MECNKEEAIRAKEIAERRMQNGDFDGARRIARKAQQLYPEIDNISQLLMVCEVHCSAQNKLNGSEMDWYGVLQIEHFSDESVVKKQYKRLALSLHPDKNKFAGAEAAFKLIGEANRVLTDATKRDSYNMKLKSLVKPVVAESALHKSSRDSDAKKQTGSANRFTNPPVSQYQTTNTYQQPFQPTFWTRCPSCRMRYQYYRELRNRVLLCQNCQRNFIAQDWGIHGVPPVTIGSQFVNGTHGPCSVALQNGGEKPASGSSLDGFTGLDPMHEAKKAVDADRSSKLEETKPQSAVKPKDADGEVQNGFSIPKPDSAKSKDTGASKFGNRKRRRKLVTEASVNHETDMSDSQDNFVAPENGGYAFAQNSAASGARRLRRSSRRKLHATYKENLSNDDDFVSPAAKRSRDNVPGGTVEEMKDCVSGAASKVENSGGSAAEAVDQRRTKIEEKATSSLEESSSNKTNKAVDNKENGQEGQEVSMSDKYDTKSKVNDGPKSKPNEEPRDLECPDPDFSEFDKDKYCFTVNQLWALYDDTDGMPRFYAWIKKVHSTRFKVQITWLEASPENKDEQDWCDGELPISCGKFEKGETQYIEDLHMFSHQMHHINGIRGSYFVYPKKGETWALFKDWEMRWSSEPDKHRPPYQYEIVEIVTDFSKDNGIGVAYLGKVRGFISIFTQTASNGILSLCIPPGELLKFSHRIPSFRMTGKEGVGVPAGSFELDPASLTSDLVNQDEPGDGEMKNANIETSCMESKPTTYEVKPTVHSEKIGTPKKSGHDPRRGTSILRRSPRPCNGPHKDGAQIYADQCGKENVNNVVSPGNLTPPEGISTSSQASEKVRTPEKRRKSELVAEALQPIRSPRDFSKKSSNVNGSSSSMANWGTGKHQDLKKDESCGRMDTPMKDGSPTGLTKSRMGPGCRVIELDTYDFQKEKSIENFQFDQIWALYGSEDGMPRNYAQIKKIESAPHFRLHVTMLESCSPAKEVTKFVCCGTFRVKNGKTKVASLAEFSHQVKPEITGKNRYGIYPRKGEVWAVYKNWNSESTCASQGGGEFDVVEVLEDTNQSVKVVVLIRINGSRPLYRAPRSGRTQAGVMDILRSELRRFSHQCCAFLHSGDKDHVLKRIWELDSSSITGNVIRID